MTTPQRAEMVRRIQTTMAAAYTGMGSWCLIHPISVLSLSLVNPSITSTSLLLTRCFGAQAMTVGLLLGTSTMTARSFTAFSVAMVPYLGFNFWFLGGPGRGVFTNWLWMDFVGNVIFAGGSAWCAYLLTEDGDEQLKKGL